MSKNLRSIGRRDLLKGTGLGVGAVAFGILAPQVARAAARVPRKWDYEADVVVVGYGAAGAAVAITAHDLGTKVLILEKAPEKYKGGNSRVAGQIVFWPNDVEKAMVYFKGMTGPYMDNISEEMLRVWATEMYNNKAWLEKLGFEAAAQQRGPEFPELAGSDCAVVLQHKRGVEGEAKLWDGVIEPAVTSRRIQTLYETPALSLLRRDAEIIGVVADQKGKRLNIKAKRAVVLTCGGFENNQTMVRNYLADMPYCYPMGTPYNTGDGIRMAMEVGADLWHMNNISGPYFYFKAPEIEVSSRVRVRGNSYIYVARDASRFVAEAPTLVIENGRSITPEKHGKIYRNGRYLQYPTPVPIYMIFDDSVRKAGGLCGRAAGWTWSWDAIYGDIYNWSKDNLREVEKGWIKRADIIPELAKTVGLNSTALEATVQRYNTFCQNHKDLEWDRRPASLAPIQTPPYYAMELVPTFINTQGGPRRNKDAQIVDAHGKPIPRLYSSGELGSIYAFEYQGGGNLAECFAFGRIAGTNAANEESWKV